ncbi:sodium/glutamate symporter [Persicirhabdus sediminis]|uniref:Sodium/glutamate symporter n=1 Tax=Persicirhabdus sediminis TaxID=454144 RepID=A0A8J7MBB7_9BACT|nr:sodium/glutamate symporter [Persicirhabdus sediminis]MBK1789846.1 hypothetical protein [Persicirhabdus sediminis]
MELELNRIWTIVVALACIELGKRLNRKFSWLEKGNIPPSVSAGLVVSLLLALVREFGWLDVSLDPVPRDSLLLVFFASLGFGAHLGKLASAGKGTLMVCIAIVVLIFTQNIIGMGVAKAFGQPAELGLFCGSIAFLGGHGTAVAWSNTEMAHSINGAFELGVGSATLGLVLGGLVAGPVAMFLSRRNTEEIKHSTLFEKDVVVEVERDHVFSSDRWIISLLFILACVAIGIPMREWLVSQGKSIPPFLAVMLVAVALTNIADLVNKPMDKEVSDLVGTVSLRIFLAMAMLSLDWGELAEYLPLLITASILQVVGILIITYFLVYLSFGKGNEGSSAAGGFIGFGLGAMPVGLAVIRRLTDTFGDCPRAILSLTLAASLFCDTANAVLISALFKWLG